VLIGRSGRDAPKLAADVGEEPPQEARQSVLSTNTNDHNTAASPTATARGGMSDSAARRARISTAAASLTATPRACVCRTTTDLVQISERRKTTQPTRNAPLA